MSRADRSRADDYYLGADTSAAQFTALDGDGNVTVALGLAPEAYAGWVDWINPLTEESMGKPRLPGDGRQGSPRFAEMVVNAPKSLSIAAALHPEVSDALDRAQQDAVAEIQCWLAQHSVTRVGPRGKQEVVPVAQLQTMAVSHRTSRAVTRTGISTSRLAPASGRPGSGVRWTLRRCSRSRARSAPSALLSSPRTRSFRRCWIGTA
ncbi:MAG: relaxase domain-containing protein [Microbacterium sp.]